MIRNGEYWLRPVEATDLSWIKNLRNDDTTWSQLGNFAFINDERQARWFERINGTDAIEYLVFGHKKDNLGLVRLTDIDRINRSMCVGGDILPERRGQGHAEHMYRLIFKLGFDIWGLHRLWLLVLSTNDVAKHVYQKLGFVEEGVQRQAIYRQGNFVDYILMSLLENEYKR